MRTALTLLALVGCGYSPAVRCDRLTEADVDALGDPGLPIDEAMQITRAEQMLSLRASAERPEQLPLVDAEGIEAWTLAPALDVVCPDRTVEEASCGSGEARVVLSAAPEGCETRGDAWVLIRHRPDAVRSVVVELRDAAGPVDSDDSDR